MTAEVAILNRSAVALAADSIVTLTGPNGSRTYDSAEKIFELSRYQPIGLMIYHNSEFANAPLEIVARRFRETLTSGQFASLVQVWPAFEEFLLGFPRDVADECSHLVSMLDGEFRSLRSSQVNEMLRQLAESRKSEQKHDANRFCLKVVKERRKELRQERSSKFLAEKTLAEFTERYGDSVESISKLAFSGASQSLLRELVGLAFDLVRSTTLSEAHTGFVLAGFGHEDLFPSLYHVTCDGIFFDQLRIVGEQEVTDIDRRGEQAAIKAFAQTDMPERFIDGIDRQFETQMKKMMDNMIAELVENLSNLDDEELTAKIKRAASARIAGGNRWRYSEFEGCLSKRVKFRSRTSFEKGACRILLFTC